MAIVLVFGVAAGVAVRQSIDRRAPATTPVASVQGAQLERDIGVDPTVTQAVRSSVTRIEATGCGERRQGTASLVDPGSGPRALTNQHVVAGAARAEFRSPDGDVVSLDVARRVADRDAALLDAGSLTDGGARPLPVGPRPTVGSTVLVAGFPAGGFEARAGHVVSVERRHGYGGTVDMLIVDVEAIPGISGGVVVDTEGRAVGLVAARDPETGDTVAYPLETVEGRTRPADSSC